MKTTITMNSTVRADMVGVAKFGGRYSTQSAELFKAVSYTHLDVYKRQPIDFTGSPKMIAARLPPKREIIESYSLKSYRRGSFSFGAVFYRITGPLGLIQRQGKIDLPQQVQVLPDMTGEGSRDLQLALAGAFQAGRRKVARRGEGSEFESLREHQRDDDFRHIDWKASAKRGKLISRQYETERDQRLMILSLIHI